MCLKRTACEPRHCRVRGVGEQGVELNRSDMTSVTDPQYWNATLPVYRDLQEVCMQPCNMCM
eukprot:9964-Eustigmatos_ZCMA.PRE.1